MAFWNSRVSTAAGQSLTVRLFAALPAHALNLTVVDRNDAPVAVGYRYLIEEDTT